MASLATRINHWGALGSLWLGLLLGPGAAEAAEDELIVAASAQGALLHGPLMGGIGGSASVWLGATDFVWLMGSVQTSALLLTEQTSLQCYFYP